MTDLSNRNRLLKVYGIFMHETDEKHAVTVPQILMKLGRNGYETDRRSIYDDMAALREFGMDIVSRRAKNFEYFLASRDFEMPELKLLVDAVQSSKFLTKTKSAKLIKKLEGLTSKHEAEQLNRQVYIFDRVKNMNEKIFYNVDTLHIAVNSKRKINFKYYEYALNKKLVAKKNGELYHVAPLMLAWADDNYYLIAVDDSSSEIRHYRVDKMSNVSITDEECQDKDFNATDYAKKVFGMYPGDDSYVDVCFDNSLVGVVIDRFGKDILIRRKDSEHFIVSLHVSVSATFLSWIFQFGNKAKIVGPDDVIVKMKKMVKDVADQY